MPLIYVTGAPGAGKTTLQEELTNRGLKTYDLDNPNLGGPHNKASGERVVIPPAAERTQDWFDNHEWVTYEQALDDLKVQAKDNTIYICGVAENDGKILHLFDKIVYLQLSDEILAKRLSNRGVDDYGKNKFELEEIIERKYRLDKRYGEMNVVYVDASMPVIDAADSIIMQH